MASPETFVAAFDGYVGNSTSTWASCHDAESGTSSESAGSILAANASYSNEPKIGDTFGCTRSFLVFDTSTLPEGITITGAELHLTTTYTYSGTYALVANSQASDTALVASDYHHRGTTSFGTITVSAAQEYILTINQDGIDTINTSGNTKFCLISNSSDLADVSPQTAGEGANFYSSNQSTEEYKPHLVITYTEGGGTNSTVTCAIGTVTSSGNAVTWVQVSNPGISASIGTVITSGNSVTIQQVKSSVILANAPPTSPASGNGVTVSTAKNSTISSSVGTATSSGNAVTWIQTTNSVITAEAGSSVSSGNAVTVSYTAAIEPPYNFTATLTNGPEEFGCINLLQWTHDTCSTFEVEYSEDGGAWTAVP